MLNPINYFSDNRYKTTSMKINKLWSISFFSFRIIVIVMLFYAAIHYDTYDAIQKAIQNLKTQDIKKYRLYQKTLTLPIRRKYQYYSRQFNQ